MVDFEDDNDMQLNNVPEEEPQLSKQTTDNMVGKYLSIRHLQALNIIRYAVDENLLPRYYSGAVKAITGYEEGELLNGGTRWENLIHPEDLPSVRTACQLLLNTREAQIQEYRIISGDGQIRWLSDMAVAITNEAGRVVAIEGLLFDITQRKTREEELLERQAHLDSILNSVQDVIWSVAPDTFELLYINPAAERVYGYPLAELYNDAANGYQLMHNGHELLLENFSMLLQTGWFEAEYCIELPDGQKRWLHRRVHFAHDAHGFVARIDGTDTDITRRKKAEDSLRYISMHDCLTGLFNRFFFEKEMFAIDSSLLESVGLIVCDVDGLKLINDSLGHEAGDQLLIQCAEVLKGCFKQTEIVARIGGDEFTVLIKKCSLHQLEAAVKKLRQSIVAHNESGPLYPLSISIGYAFKSAPDISMGEVFRQADNQMYAEKPENHQRFHKLYRTLKI